MKILKAYINERQKAAMFGTDSPLVREIKKKYEYDEMIFPQDMSDEEKAKIIREYDVLLTMWASPVVPVSLAENPGRLKCICNITGGLRDWIDIRLVESDKITVANWGDAPAYSVAEGAFSLLMSVMKDIPMHVRNANENGHSAPKGLRTGSLFNARVGIFGMGVIARKFVEFLRPFNPIIYGYDPYVDNMPDGVVQAESLQELFSNSQIVVVHAGLTPETEGIINSDLLSRLPDGGIIINTARGAIIENSALENEIASGRIRAGLDVFYPSDMPEDTSPLRRAENCILTAHNIGLIKWGIDPDALDQTAINCLKNLECIEQGKLPQFIVTPKQYKLMT